MSSFRSRGNHIKKMFKALLLLLCLTCYTGGDPIDYCQPGYLVRNLPEKIAHDLYTFAIGKEVKFNGNCSYAQVDRDLISFWYNSKNNPSEPTRLYYNNFTEIDSSKPIVFAIHGWLCSINSNLMPELKNAYLQRYNDINVIRVEWNNYTGNSFVESFCHVPKIAEVIGSYICDLYSILKIDLDNVHIVGHSMGAQIAGLSGKEIQKQCNQTVGRVTGLDPARPIFENMDEDGRLHKTDGKVVDVIHTNQKYVGISGNIGTVDFYPNCGFAQPNSSKLSTTTQLKDIHSWTMDKLLRSHVLAIEYFVESILHQNFVANTCTSCDVEDCIVDRISDNTTIMGQHYQESSPITKSYYVLTNGVAPYSRETTQ